MAISKKIRIFTDQDINQNLKVKLVDRNINYLKNVMRCKNGDTVRIFNGKDGEWFSEIRDIEKNPYLIPYQNSIPQSFEKDHNIWLVFSLIKSNRSRLLIEKATELGVSKIFIVLSMRSNVKTINIEKAMLTAIESAEQCGRISVPNFEYFKSFSDLLSKWPQERSFIWGDTRLSSLKEKDFYGAGGLILGPEGGFTQEEIELFSKFSNSKPVSMGSLILRSETAAVSMLTIWNTINKVW